MTQLEKTAKTFETLKAIHAVLGDTSPCSWDAYRAEMTCTYDINGQILDAIARLGYFHTTGNSVRFAA